LTVDPDVPAASEVAAIDGLCEIEMINKLYNTYFDIKIRCTKRLPS
jgi:hypothetical protein